MQKEFVISNGPGTLIALGHGPAAAVDAQAAQFRAKGMTAKTVFCGKDCRTGD